MSDKKEKTLKQENKEVYTVEEFVQATEVVFGGMYSKALVFAALRYSGKTEATLEEAKQIVKTFAERKVGI